MSKKLKKAMTMIWCIQNQILTMKTQVGEKQKMQIGTEKREHLVILSEQLEPPISIVQEIEPQPTSYSVKWEITKILNMHNTSSYIL